MSDNDKTVILDNVPPAPTSASGGQRRTSQNVLQIGTRLSEFEIIGLIGEGGFGIVYLAIDHSLERRVAIKEYMPTSLAERGEDASVTVRTERHRDTFDMGRRSFVNEARLLAKFDHPALVKVHRFWEANDTAYMAMPFYEGRTLRAELKKRETPPDEAWIKKMLAPIIDALEVIHRDKCYHRDIAPDNIMLLNEDDRPVLLDFGAARRVIGDMTHALTVIVKTGYAPIEQYAEVPEMKQGPWTDIYALGAVVYHMITGRTPPPAVSRMIQDACEPLAKEAAGRYSDSFLRGIDACLGVRPEARPQSMAEMRRLLGLGGAAPAAAEAPATPPPPRIVRAPGAGPLSEVPKTAALPAAPTPVARRWPPFVWAAALGALIVALVVAYLVWPRTAVPGAGGAPVAAPSSEGAPYMTLSGSNTIGAVLAPMLVESWLKSLGATETAIEHPSSGDTESYIRARLDGKPIWVRIKAHGSEDAFTDLDRGEADIGMASRPIKAAEAERLKPLGNMTSHANEHVLALDGIAVIVAPGNPTRALKLSQLDALFTGATQDWKELGAPAAPISRYARDDKSGTYAMFKARVMHDKELAAGTRRFEDSEQLEWAVASDPAGIGFVGFPFAKTARMLAIADGTGPALMPTELTVRREDYPLSRRLYLYSAAVPRNPHALEFVNFALSGAGQQVVRAAGFFDLDVSPVSATEGHENCRLSDAWSGDKDDYCRLIQSAQVLQTSFRFKSGASELDNRAYRDLRRVVSWLEAHPGKQLVLAGFSDNQTGPADSIALSRQRTAALFDALQTLGVPAAHMTQQAFGAELPVAENADPQGRDRNCRVEVFVR